ncbi:hypothetical protein [Moraxella lacunata]
MVAQSDCEPMMIPTFGVPSGDEMGAGFGAWAFDMIILKMAKNG